MNRLLGILQTIHMKCQDLFSSENKKIKLSSSLVVTDALRVNKTERQKGTNIMSCNERGTGDEDDLTPDNDKKAQTSCLVTKVVLAMKMIITPDKRGYHHENTPIWFWPP